METKISLQLKDSVSQPVVVACQKDSGTTVEKCTQVKPVILTAMIFAVHFKVTLRFVFAKLRNWTSLW